MNEPGVGADWRKQQPDNGDKEQHGPCRQLPHELPIGWPPHEGPETHASNSLCASVLDVKTSLLMRLSGSDPSASRRTSVGNGSGLSGGDRNRNARLARLRELVPHSNAIVGIDLADDKQAAVVTDDDSRAIARRQVRARARGSWASGWTGRRAGQPGRVLRR